MEVFLDLEETVITNWYDFVLIYNNCSLIKQFLRKNKIRSINIYSFTIYN